MSDDRNLANKYRPQVFDDLVGQEEVKLILKKQIEEDNLRSAYLFFGSAGCVDCDTEFFTGIGWKRISEYVEGDKVLQYNEDGTAQLVYPLRYIHQESNLLYEFKTKYGINQCLSGNHTVVYETSKGHLRTKLMSDLITQHYRSKKGFTGKFYTTFKYSLGEGIPLSDDEIRLMCAVISDGSFSHWDSESCTSCRCRIRVKKKRKVERIKNLLESCNTEYQLKFNNTTGYSDITFYAPRREKSFGEFWYKCNSHQMELILDEYKYWDGDCEDTYFTGNRDIADFLQFIASATGKRASIYSINRGGQDYITGGKQYIRRDSYEYKIHIARNRLVGLGDASHTPITEYIPRDGQEYCFEVPSHMLVLRRGNNIFITGNCGKTTSARCMARSINGSLAGLVEVDAASNNGVDSVRELTELSKFKPIGYKKKVYIVDEAHMLSASAWAAFLKTIEDGVKDVIFIFCTTERHKVPATIISRCQVFDFKRIRPEDVKKRLKFIQDSENKEFEECKYKVSDECLDYISRMANGGMRLAISMYEKVINYNYNPTIKEVAKILGTASYDIMYDLMESVYDRKPKNLVVAMEELNLEGVDFKLVMKDFVDFNLELLKYNLTKDSKYTTIPEYYLNNRDSLYGVDFLMEINDALLSSTNEIKGVDDSKNYMLGKLLQLC